VFVAMMFSARARWATDVAIGAARLGQQCADSDQTAAALGRAPEATVGLDRRARTPGVLAFQRCKDLRIGQNVAGTYNHRRRVV